MTPFMFGPAARRLFGVFHPADERRATRSAVLLCAPFGHEALRVHRFYRVLADRLSRQGVAVLRFDYFGTGDAGGDDEDGDLDGWAQDIAEAHRELLRRSGALQISWFGARLGATLALRAAPQATPPVQRLLLWEPVLDGPAYLQALSRAHVDELALSHSLPEAGWTRALRKPDAFAGECLGFAISPALREGIAALRPHAPGRLGVQHVSVLAPPADAGAAQWTEAVHALQPGAQVSLAPLEHPLIWTSNPHANNEMVPAEALQRMMSEPHGNH